MSRTREQIRADKAYSHAESMKDSAGKDDYGRYAHKMPILIRTAGLAQAIAYAEAKGKDKPGIQKLLDHLAQQLQISGLLQGGNNVDRSALSAASKTADLSTYRMFTHEIQSCLVWYKRFALSVLEVEAGQEEKP